MNPLRAGKPALVGVGVAALAALLVAACSVGTSDDETGASGAPSSGGSPGAPANPGAGDPNAAPNGPSAAPGSPGSPGGTPGAPQPQDTSSWARDRNGNPTTPPGW